MNERSQEAWSALRSTNKRLMDQAATSSQLIRDMTQRLEEVACLCRGMVLYTGLDCAEKIEQMANELEANHG